MSRSSIRYADWVFALTVAAVFALLKLAAHAYPQWNISENAALIPFLLTIVYILRQARTQPELLDVWGVTPRLTPAAVGVALALLAASVAILFALGTLVRGHVAMEPALLFRMTRYLPAAFPQQFFLCAVGISTLAAIPAVAGRWKLPLLAGLLFALAHFWTEKRFPGVPIPAQMLITAPFGAALVAYFMRYRNLLLVTLLHAVLYILWSRWVETHL